MIRLKNLLNESVKLDLDKAYDVFNKSYINSTGKSWDKDKFLQRASNWTFHGDDNGYVAVRPQKGGLIKLVGVAGSLKSIYKGMQEVKHSYNNQPVWGMVSSDIAKQLEKLGGFLVVRVSGGIKTKIFLNVIKKIIPSSVFGGAEIKGINSDGTITFAYNDIGESNKVLVGNKHYMEYLKQQILSNTSIPDFVKNQAVQMLPENIQSNLDEERKFPHLNPKLSIPDAVLKFAERDDTFISFRALLKGGLNPNSSWDTPIGIYMYPAKMALEKYGKSDELGIKFPFAIEKPYVYFIIKKPNIKELNIDTYTKQDGDRDMDKLIKIYSSKISEKILNDLKKDSPQLTKHKNVNVGAFWYFCYKLSEMLLSEKGGKSSIYWTKMLKKDLGYDLVIDSGNSVIHGNEPCQAFFTNENAFTINTVIEKSNVGTNINNINYEKIANNPKVLSMFLRGRTNKLTHDNVSGLLHNSRDKQKMVDVLLSKNVSLTDDNVRTLLTYSTDPQKTIDVLLSKNITLTDSNVHELLIYSTDKQKTIDMLLSKNITLTDANVRELLIYSTDKQKMVDVLLSKGLSIDKILTNYNVGTLLHHSPDLQKTIDILLSKGLSIDKILTDTNVRELLSWKTDKQKTIDMLLSKNVSLTDANVSNLLSRSPDRQKTIDMLLSKNVPLTDANVHLLLIYSTDPQKMVDVLLSKGLNIDKILTDTNVRELLQYSTDKQKTIDMLLSKNVPLTSGNVSNLLIYSTDKQKTIDMLLSKNITLTDANVRELLIYSTDKQKMVDVLLSKNITLTDNNVSNLLHHSPDRQKTIDMLLSKNVPLTSGNVHRLLDNSPDRQKTIDMLLSKNVSLTDDNVRYLLHYSTDKQKTIDMLLSKNVPLTHYNVRYLLSYSPDKQDTQQKIDMLKSKQQLSESKIKYTDYYSYLNELDYKVEPYDVHPNGLVGWKGKIVYTTPDKFLSLAKKLEHPSKTSLAYLKDKMSNEKPLPYLMLWVDMNNKKVTGHEGRHRAMIAKELEIEKLPVFVFTGEYTRTPKWTTQDHDVVDNLKFSPEL